MKKLVITAALALVSITMSAQDIDQFSNVSKAPKTYKLTKAAGAANPGQQSQDSLASAQRAYTLQQLTAANPTVPIRLGAAYLRKSANSSRSILTATVRSIKVSSARKTTAMPPLPITSSIL